MKKSTAIRSLLLSGLSMLLCFSMLIGSTFAWFTDEVTSGTNTIVAGNLDVELYNGLDDSAEKVGPSTMLFDKIALWEPGAVMFENFTVANEGNLALKYNFSVNITEATANNLADVLKVGVVEGGIAEKATRAEALAAVTSWMPFASFVEAGTLDAGESDVYGIVIWWEPTDNDNAYKEASVNIGVNLFATQLEAESDSFGDDYDEKADFSVWDGTVPAQMPETLVVDGATQTILVKDAAAFAYLSTLSANWRTLYANGGTTYTDYANGAGADYYYSGKWTVSLEADIDLDNHAIAPVAIVIGQSTGATAFNGNGHTIRNINATTGLFANNTRASFSNLTLDTVTATNGALAGAVNHSVTNVTVKNATVSGADYVGGLVGKTYSSVTGCKVIDSSVTATGKEAGGLIGYAETNSKGSVVAYNTVNNVTIYAGNRAAGLVAQPNANIMVHNNVIDTVIVGAADTSSYQPGAVVSNALAPENVYDNVATNAVVGTGANTDASDNAGFEAALKDTTSECIIVNVDADVTYDVAAWATDAMGGNVTKVIVINGNGHTITFNQTNSDWNNIVTNGAKLIINDAKITNSGKNDGPWNRHDLNFACDVELNNVTSDKALAFKAGATLKNVTINDANTSDTYAIWIQPKGQTIDIDGLVIDMLDCTDGRGIKIDNQYLGADEEAAVTLNIKNATFKTEEKSAILVKSTKGATINAENIDITGVAADATNAVWVDEASSAYANLVKVNGASVIVEP